MAKAVDAEEAFDVDRIIAYLSDVSLIKHKPLSENDYRTLCDKSQAIFLEEESLLHLDSPVTIVGDILGEYAELLRIFKLGGLPPEKKYLFLGNFVNRGKNSIEVICLILAYKIKYPGKVFLLRGHYETVAMTRIHGFYHECKREINIKMWKRFQNTFNCLPIAAVVNRTIFCVHGGISPDLNSLQQISEIERPVGTPEKGLLCDLVWSHPCDGGMGWAESDRGVSYQYGDDVVSEFLQKCNLTLIIRSRELQKDGYSYSSKRKVLTIYSNSNTYGEFNNPGSFAEIDENGKPSIQLLHPMR